MPLILLNKPYRVLSQFTTDSGKETLAAYVRDRHAYPAGRLDYDSEGLLALTDHGPLQARLSEPAGKLAKVYRVQVEGEAGDNALQSLQQGVALKDGPAQAIYARRIATPGTLWPRDPPIRVRKAVPDCWIELALDEGRNRQVRRMTAAVGLPTLRLIRWRIGPWSLDNLVPGDSRELTLDEAWRDLDRYRPLD
ncbi:MAG: pseudouridine synthase [Gammaproteobacteria bacterium]|nr:pseudouridine synthase [Gammaproteobacteria bacterium]